MSSHSSGTAEPRPGAPPVQWLELSLWALPSLLLLATHSLLGLFSRFAADDYCTAARARAMGIIGAAVYNYNTWSGRYSADLLDSAAGFLGPAVTPFLPGVAVACWLLALTCLLMPVSPGLGRMAAFAYGLAGAAIILASVLYLAPDIPQSLYWGQGMRSVIPPLVLATAWCGLFIRSSLNPNRLAVALACVLPFIAGGFSETYVALQTFLLGVVYLFLYFAPYGLRLTRTMRSMLLGALVGSCASLILVVIAPGNAVRQALFPPPPDLMRLASIAFDSMLAFLAFAAGGAAEIIVLFSVAGYFLLSGLRNSIAGLNEADSKAKISISLVLLFAIGSIAALYVCFLPSAYGRSARPPARSLMIPSYVLICATASGAYAVGRFLRGKLRSYVVAVTWLIACLGAFVMTIEVRHLAGTIGNCVRYAREWDSADAFVRQMRARKCRSVVLYTVPNQFGLDDAGADPSFWVNGCVSEYYGVDVRRAESGGAQAAAHIGSCIE